jgi:hypothetical protein
LPTPPPQLYQQCILTLLQSLPACKRCRECRRGCDTSLPKCRYSRYLFDSASGGSKLTPAGNAQRLASSACSTTMAEKSCCLAGMFPFVPHARRAYLLTCSLACSYISELVDHVRRLSGRDHPSPATSGQAAQDASLVTPAETDSTFSDTNIHYEHHFAFAGDSYRYLGSESCLLMSPRLHTAYQRSPFEDDEEFEVQWKDTPEKRHELVEEYLQVMYGLQTPPFFGSLKQCLM